VPTLLLVLQVALVVLDSATFHFRQDFADAAQRGRVLLHMAQQLAEAAEQRGVAVVMVNQVVTRITDSAAAAAGASSTSQQQQQPSSGSGLLAPALGEGWGQAASCRVALFWEGQQRRAMVAKPKHVPLLSPAAQGQAWPGSMCVPYHVGPTGIS
jgi:RAD51-like protein 2